MISPIARQAELYLDEDMAKVRLYELAIGSAAVMSTRCPHKTTSNEDAAALIELDHETAVLVVADGVGGERAGAQASALTVETLQNALLGAVADGDSWRTAILNGIETANRKVLDLGIGAATTLALVELQNHIVRHYHVGDSAVLVTGNHGKIKLQTTAHSPVGFAVESGMLKEIEAMHHEDRHLVSNVVGLPDMRVELGSAVTMAPRDTLLIASDGLCDNLHTKEIVEYIRKGSLKKAAQTMTQTAKRRMTEPRGNEPSKPDDMTFILFRQRTKKHSEPTKNASQA